MLEAFAERGEIVNLEQIRIALNRIAKDGNLMKVGPSLFAVAAHDTPEVGAAAGAARGGPDPGSRGSFSTVPSRAVCQPVPRSDGAS